MKKKILIGVVIVLGIGGYEAKAMLLPPKVVKMKVDGQVYVLPHQFTVNLADGRYATITAALILGPGQTDGSSATASATSTDSVVGTLPEEAVIRDIITNVVTGANSQTLISASGREALKHKILAAIASHTDDKIAGVLFPDMAVQ